MALLADQLDGDTLTKLTRFQVQLITEPPAPPPAGPTSAICPTCGQRRPVPEALFSEAAR